MPEGTKKDRKGIGGRPSLYNEKVPEQAEKLCALGATDADLADFFGVKVRTIENWKIAHPEFMQAIKDAKELADARVERSLYQRAMGYEIDAVKIFMPAGADAPVYAPYREKIPPSDTACIFWLKNRQREKWRDKQDHEHTGEIKCAFGKFDEDL